MPLCHSLSPERASFPFCLTGSSYLPWSLCLSITTPRGPMCPTNPGVIHISFLLSPLLVFKGLMIILSYLNCSLLFLPHWAVIFRKAFYPHCLGRTVTDWYIVGSNYQLDICFFKMTYNLSLTLRKQLSSLPLPSFWNWKIYASNTGRQHTELDLTNTFSYISHPGFFSGVTLGPATICCGGTSHAVQCG